MFCFSVDDQAVLHWDDIPAAGIREESTLGSSTGIVLSAVVGGRGRRPSALLSALVAVSVPRSALFLAVFWNKIVIITVLVLRMAHRIWKETKQQPGTAGPGHMLGCCLLSFNFLWTILSTSIVEVRYIHRQNVKYNMYLRIQFSRWLTEL